MSPPPQVSTAPEDERRLVTALFCDLVGSTELADQLDAEDVRDILALYFEAMDKHITHYGGSIEKYAGDAVLALFGVPSAHEDDAERAVLCGLAMQGAIQPVADSVRQRHGVALAIRVGVDTGEVVSGEWGRQGEAVIGDSLNTAARIQAAAEPGGLLVGAATMRLTRRRITYGPDLKLTLKGKSGLVTVYRALAIRQEIGERWESLARTAPLLGREREISEILDAWQRAVAGEGQLITVIGEPGVGKSRLLAEAIGRVEQLAPTVRVLRGRCLSYGQGISLSLIADLLRSALQLREDDSPAAISEQVTMTLTGLLQAFDREDQRESIDVLGEVLGLPALGSMVALAGPQVRRAALIRGLRRVLGALTEQSPVVLLLEDLHWIDRASQEVIVEAVLDVPGLRMLVLAAQRQGWSAPWSDWSWIARMSIRPLGEADAAQLAAAVIGEPPPSSDLLSYLAGRAGGNPFFVEELVQALREADALEEHDGSLSLKSGSSEKLPFTLTEVLQARLDRLDAPVKKVAQVGSVIGRGFAVPLLAQVMQRQEAALELPLTGLQRAELAFPRRNAELEYVFKHVTVQEVAYGMLTRRRRKELHRRAARAVADRYPGEEHVEIIAHHYARTDEPEAAEWLERAGDRAAAVYATDTALTHYREAARRMETSSARKVTLGADLAPARVAEKVGAVLSAAGHYDDALAELQRAADLFRQ